MIGAAGFRSAQDAQCSKQPLDCKRHIERIERVYVEQMKELIKKDLGENKIPTEMNYLPASKEVEEAIKDVALKTLSVDKLPNPIWIAGLNPLSYSSEARNIRPRGDHKKLR